MNEIERIAFPAAASGGTFTLTFQGQSTAAIAYNASAATVQSALEALSNLAVGDVVVTGGSRSNTQQAERMPWRLTSE